MSIEFLLMDFGTPTGAVNDTAPEATMNLDSFEEGYNAGWADAVKANKDEQSEQQAQLAESVKDFAFSRTEVQQHTLRELRPLIEGVLTAILPAALRPALAPMIVEALEEIAADSLSDEIVLAVPEGLSGAVSGLIDLTDWPDLTVSEDDRLGDGRAEIRCGDTTKAVDLGAVQTQITQLVSEFFNDPQLTAATGTEG